MDGILWNWPNEENEGFFNLFIYLFIYLCNTFHSADSEEKKNVRVDGNFSILELLDISVVNKIKGMQENADIVQSDLG